MRRFFLGITTACNMDCTYCFVNPTNEVMKIRSAKKYVKYFLSSGGDDKLLYFYGGEPFLFPKLIQEVDSFLVEEAKRRNKKTSVLIVTNGTLLSEDISDYLKKYSPKLMVSLSGTHDSHDLFRKIKGETGSFGRITENLKTFLRLVKEKDLWVSYTIHPKMLDNFYKDLDYLLKLGFANIHIEPVQFTEKVHWNKYQLESFEKTIEKFFGQIQKNIEKGIFIFNSKIIRDIEIMFGIAPQDDFLYSVYNNLRAWPGDRLAFSHFLINLEEKRELPNDIAENYGKSIEIGRSGSKKARAGERVWGIYDAQCRKFAKDVMIKAQKNKQFQRYIKECLTRAI